jgi:hypothetical protein
MFWVQNRAVRNLFTGPNMIEDVALTVASLRSGDLKLRVRALEAERALDRVQVIRTLLTAANRHKHNLQKPPGCSCSLDAQSCLSPTCCMESGLRFLAVLVRI